MKITIEPLSDGMEEEIIIRSNKLDGELRNLIKAKKLPILRVGTKHLIRIDALTEFMKLNEGVDLRDIDSVKPVN